MPEQQTMHLDYAEEAQSAERAEAWPQAAALWRRAAELARVPTARNTYLKAAETCDRRMRIDAKLADIAKRVLKVPTLRYRHQDGLDFHELGVGSIRMALRAAYEAGRAAARNEK